MVLVRNSSDFGMGGVGRCLDGMRLTIGQFDEDREPEQIGVCPSAKSQS